MGEHPAWMEEHPASSVTALAVGNPSVTALAVGNPSVTAEILCGRGEPTLWLAAKTANIETARALTEAGANLELSIQGAETPLLVAARNGHNRMVQSAKPYRFTMQAVCYTA